MTKNKKKLRRVERRYSVTKSAQTLVLAGMLLAGGVSGAMAATINDTGSGAVSIDASTTASTGNTNFKVNSAAPAFESVTSGTAYTTLTIVGSASNVSLTAKHKLTFTGITLSGASGGSGTANSGLLLITAGNTTNDLFTGGATNINDYGVLKVGADAAGAAGANGTAKLDSLNITANGGLQLGGMGLANGSTNHGGTGDLVIDGALDTAAGLNIGGEGGAGTGGAGSNGGEGSLTVDGNFTSTLATAQTIGGKGGNGISGGGAGGAGGEGTLTLKGEVSSFAGALNIGGTSGTADTSAGGIGGEGTLNLAAGKTSFNGAVQIGAANGGASNGAAGSLNIYGGAEADFNENVIIGAASSNASTLQIGGNADGTNNTGAGIANLKAGKTLTFTATNKLLVGGAGSVGANGGDGTLNVHGTLTGTNGTLVFGGAGANGNAGNAGNAGGIGTINIKSGGAATFVASQVIGGAGGNNSGTAGGNGGNGGDAILNIESGAGAVVFGTLTVGGTGGTSGNANGGNGGAGTVNVNNATQTFANTVTLGGAASSTSPSANGGKGGMGTLNINAGETTFSNSVQVGGAAAFGGDGELNIAADAKANFSASNTFTIGGAAANAGNGVVNVKGTAIAGNAVTVGTASNGTGTINITEDGAFRLADTKTMTINNGTVTAKSYTVGDSTSHATATGLVADLVDINGAAAKLVVDGPQSLNKAELSSSATAGIKLQGGTLQINGVLTISDGTATGHAMGVGNGATVQAQSLVSKVTSNAYTWTAGTLHLTGDGTKASSVLDAKELTLSTANSNVSFAAADATGGGSYAGTINVNDGLMTFGKGDWTVQNAAKTGTIKVGNGATGVGKGLLLTDGGKLTVDNLHLAGNANTVIGDGTNASVLTVAGNTTTAGSESFKNPTDYASNVGIEVKNLSTLKVQYNQVLNGNALVTAADGKIKVNSGAMLYLDGTPTAALNATQLTELKKLLDGGTGLLNLGEASLGLTDAQLTYANVNGLTSNDLLDKSMQLTVANAAAGVSGGFSSLEVTDTNIAANTPVPVTINNTLILTGGDKGTQLVTAGVSGTGKITLNVLADQVLTFGNQLTDSAPTYGTHKGDVTLAAGSGGAGLTTFNAVNGIFDVTGDLSVLGANTLTNVSNADLTIGTITNTGGNTTAVNVNGGSLKIAKGTATVGDVLLNGGALANLDKSITGALTNGDLTVGAVTTSGEGNKLSAGNDLTVGSFKQVDEDGNDVAGKVSNATIFAGNNMTVTTGGVTATNTSMTATKTLTLTAGDIVGDNLRIDADKLVVTAGDVSLDNGSTLNTKSTAGTGGTGASTIAGNLIMTGAQGTVGDLTTTGTGLVTLTEGASLTAKTLTAGGNITVGSNVENSTGKLSAEVLALGANTLFVDPAWVEGQSTHETGYASQVAVEKFSALEATANNITGKVIGGQASQITLGSTDLAWVQKKLDAYNATHGTNIWGDGDNLVSAALGIVSPFTVTTGSLVVDGTADSTPGAGGSAYFGEKSLLIVDAKGVGADTALKADTITVKDNAKLMLTNATVGTKYSIAKATTGLTIDGASWNGANILTDHKLLAGVLDKTTDTKEATVTINQRSATSVLPGLSSEMGGLIDNMIKQNHVSENSPHAGVRFANRAINRLNGDQAAATIEGAAQLAVVGAAPAMTLSAVQAGTSTVTTRTSFASPLMDSSKAVALHKDVDGTLSVDSGLNAGNGMKNGFGLWIMPLYQSNSAWGMKADGFKGGYKSDLGGVALGADYTFNDMFRLGLAFNIGGGYAESNGDFNKTENSFNFWGINAYGGWTMNNFGITADVGYTGNYNKLEQELPGAMGMGDIKSDVNSSAWTAGLRGEYKFATEALDIIPHVGVRYTGLTTDEYKAKSGGDTVFKVDQDFQSIWTFPIGVTLAKEIETGSGWIIRPQVDLGITPATGDVKAKSKVRIPGVDGQAEMKMQVVDYMSYDGGVGLEMKKDNVSFGINYNIQASEHRTGHGVFGTFRYEF